MSILHRRRRLKDRRPKRNRRVRLHIEAYCRIEISSLDLSKSKKPSISIFGELHLKVLLQRKINTSDVVPHKLERRRRSASAPRGFYLCRDDIASPSTKKPSHR